MLNQKVNLKLSCLKNVRLKKYNEQFAIHRDNSININLKINVNSLEIVIRLKIRYQCSIIFMAFHDNSNLFVGTMRKAEVKKNTGTSNKECEV